MSDSYEPASDFLKAIVAEEVPLSDSPMAEANMQHLITMTRDPDRSNRDWATMLLLQVEADTPEIRAALFAAADDKYDVVRAEALLGIASYLIPRFDGAILSLGWKEAAWDKLVTGAPRPRTPSEQQYSDRKLRSRR